AHPAGAVRLLEGTTGRQWLAAIEDADVVQSEKTALEHVAPVGILAVDPPSEVQQELVEYALEERPVTGAPPLFLDLVDAPRRPRLHRGVDVAERPLVSRQLPVGMHVPLAQHQDEQLLRKL